MIVRIQTGRSFHGAALYHLHDKRGKHELLRLSDERVAWTSTSNTASNVPELAIQEMIAIAEHQQELKRESGQSLGGRPCENPVMTIALSWHPAEKPTKEQMIEATHSFLDHMGWEEHQALLLAHNDTQHQHVHVILNRIHPYTGLVHDDSHSFHRSQRWRENYTRDHSHEFQPKQRGHIPYEQAIGIRDGAAHYAQLEAVASRSVEQQERDQLALRHQKEREAFLDSRHQQFRQTRQDAFQQVREAFASRWRGLFEEEQQLKKELKALRKDTGAQAVRFAREGDFDTAYQTLLDPPAPLIERQDRLDEIREERRELREEQRQTTRERQDIACKQLYGDRAEEFTAIKLRQKEERGELKQLQAARDEGQPHDQERLAELTSERGPELTQPYRSFASGMDGAVQSNDVKAREGDTARILSPTEQREARQQIEHEAEHATGPNEKAPNRDGFDGLAGGIGKIAEIASDILGNIFAPPTPRERAHEQAKAAAREEAEPERQAVQAKAADDLARATEAQIRAYFEEHGERIAREDEDRRAKQRRGR